jgi:hypothetical protein
MNSSLTIILGDVGNYLSEYAKQIDKQAYFVDQNNALLGHQGVIYTSIGDIISLEIFFKLLKSADRIVYYPPVMWSDKKTNQQEYSAAWLTEHYLQLVMPHVIVDNFSLDSNRINYDIVERQTDNPQMWVTGCSTTFGIGVSEDERYWELVRKKLGLTTSMLAEPAASNPWCRDQLFKCNIKSGDLVIWGLTTLTRFPWASKNKITHVYPQFYKSNPDFNNVVNADTLSDAHRIYESVSSVQQVVSFCRKIGAHLIIASIHANLEIAVEVAKYKEFLFIHGPQGLDWNSSFLDYGDDNMHPGPETHKMYANNILKKITDLDIFKGITP